MKNKTLLLVIFYIACHRPQIEMHQFKILSECHLPGYSRDIDLKGNYAYIANDQGGLQIVDITNPESTFVVGSYLCQRTIRGVAVRDSFAYALFIASQNSGLLILNIKDHKNPTYIGEDPNFYPYRISAPLLDSKYVYIAASYWFIVEDVSDPHYPSYVRRFATPGNVHGVFIVDSFFYLACEQMGLIIFNLNQPDSTAKVGEIDTPSNARGIFTINGYAYIADGSGGLVIVDVERPDSLKIVGRYDTPGYAQGVYVKNNLAYIADREEGLQVIDVTNPEEPKLYGELITPYSYNLYVRNDYIYLVDRDLGLVIIKEDKE